jgi:biopolymer transport protein ExbB
MLEFIQKGGPIMYPLLACSVIAVAIIIERLFQLRAVRNRNREAFEIIIPLVEGGLLKQARQTCLRSPGVFTNIIAAALEARKGGREEVKTAILDAGRQEIPHMERHLVFLGTIAAASPLLGLLGTVSGMIKIFQVIGDLGVGQASALSSGISEAMFTTAFGLAVAIPSLVMHNFLRERAENLILDIEKRSIQVMNRLFDVPGAEPVQDRSFVEHQQIRKVEN